MRRWRSLRVGKVVGFEAMLVMAFVAVGAAIPWVRSLMVVVTIVTVST